jgi:transposase
MKETLNIETERVDDIPLLLAHMQRMKLVSLLDKHFPVHGNRKGLSLGSVVIVWLAHILSEGDHRMNHVRDWAAQRQATIRKSGLSTFDVLDMTDDRLADVLRIFSNNDHWRAFEQDLMGNLVRVYELKKECVRIDTTTIKSYAEAEEHGLLQYGFSKDHRPDLPQLKIVLATLDPFGMPLATEVLSGEHADDPQYLPIIARIRDGLRMTGLLYIGDCKIGSMETRASIQFHGDCYLSPLSAIQVPSDHIRRALDELKKQDVDIIEVYDVNDQDERICIARGYETSIDLKYEINGQIQTWTELRFLTQSTRVAEAEKHSLLKRLEKAEQAIQNILVKKQGKPRITKRIELDEAIQKVIEKFHVEGLLTITVHEEMQEKRIRSYKGKPEEIIRNVTYTITSERNEESISYAIDHLGWRVYATNQKKGTITLEQVIEAYHDEYLVERCFRRFKGHPLSLAPMYLQRDDHRVGLVRLLSIALRVLTLLEGAVRKNLQEQENKISGLYAGNPKRSTDRPTAELLLKAFKGITLNTVHTSDFTQAHIPHLSSLQQQILALLGYTPVIYSQLTNDS